MEEYSNFTLRAQQALSIARSEAERLNHNFIGPEHILLGLLKLECVASRVLARLKFSLAEIASQLCVEGLIEKGPDQRAIGVIPLTPGAKEVLSLARSEAKSFGHTYAGTEHILLGLILREGSPVSRIFRKHIADIDIFRQAIIRELNPLVEMPAKEEKFRGCDFQISWTALLSFACNPTTKIPANGFGGIISMHTLVLLSEYGPKVQPGSPILRSLDDLLMHGLPYSETTMYFCSAYKRLLGESARRHIETLFQKTAMGSKEETRIGQVLQTLTGARTVVRVTERDFLGLAPSSSATATPVSATSPA